MLTDGLSLVFPAYPLLHCFEDERRMRDTKQRNEEKVEVKCFLIGEKEENYKNK